MRLRDSIEQLFTDNPDLSKAEAVKRLKEEKNPETNKSLWKPSTIRSFVSTYFNKKKDSAMHIKAPAESIEPRSNLKIEEKEITRHKPKDPFAIELDGNVAEKVYQIKDKMPVADTEQFRKDIIDDVSKKILKQAYMDGKPFRIEIMSIISDLISEIRDEFTNVEKEISNLRTQSIPACEPIVKYDNLKLKESTIDAIQKNTEEKELKEESENDKLSYNKKPVGRFGINPKYLIAGIAIGISIGLVAIWLICTALTTVPPPTPPPIP